MNLHRITLLFIYLCFFTALGFAQVVPVTNPTKMVGKAAYRKGLHDGMQNQLQAFVPRKDYGRLLEKEGKVYHGAGQDHQAFLRYQDALPVGVKPSVYMTYFGLKNLKDGSSLEKKLNQITALNPNLIPQIGLAMAVDGKPELHYEQDVVSGLYDKEIEVLVQVLKRYDKPVFLRLGYEFNGFWNGYQPESYKAAYQRVANAIRKAGLQQVAMMWCFAVDSDEDQFMKFYPGDAYVDWWSIDVFSAWHFERPELNAFMDSALAHRYPVMIGESTPRRMPVQRNDSTWHQWYVPYFNLVRTYPNMKGICYINWNWAGTPWPDWGDARIEIAPAQLKDRYIKELEQPWWHHGQ